jgi:hypothetical protein
VINFEALESFLLPSSPSLPPSLSPTSNSQILEFTIRNHFSQLSFSLANNAARKQLQTVFLKQTCSILGMPSKYCHASDDLAFISEDGNRERKLVSPSLLSTPSVFATASTSFSLLVNITIRLPFRDFSSNSFTPQRWYESLIATYNQSMVVTASDNSLFSSLLSYNSSLFSIAIFDGYSFSSYSIVSSSDGTDAVSRNSQDGSDSHNDSFLSPLLLTVLISVIVVIILSCLVCYCRRRYYHSCEGETTATTTRRKNHIALITTQPRLSYTITSNTALPSAPSPPLIDLLTKTQENPIYPLNITIMKANPILS